MKLSYRKIGEGQPLLVLHGLFGSSDNWQTLAKHWAEKYQVFLIDQRNHGHSPHSEEFSYELMAEDLAELVAEEGLRDIVLLGHSMGGKTAMTFAQNHSFLIDKLIVVDMGIKEDISVITTLFSKDFFMLMRHMFLLDHQAESRLKSISSDISTSQFLLKNLYWEEPGKLNWRFNLNVLNDKIDGCH
ncbi:MAG: alpha/beta fold hydrolase [Flavobacteriales bacterium]